MPQDVETQPAASSPAAEPTSAPAPSPAEEPPSIPDPSKDPDGYAEWRQTGKLPEKAKSSEKEESAPSRKKSSEEEDSAPSDSAGRKPGKAAPASDAGNKRQGRTEGETRKEDLNREIRELLKQRDELRREVQGTGKPDVKAEPSPAPEPEGLKRPVKPKEEDFKSWSEYETARDKYLEDLAEYKAAGRIEAHEQRQRQEALARDMQNRLNEAKSRYGDEAEPKIVETAKTVFDDKGVAPALKAAMSRSDVLVDALYVMGSDPDELAGYLTLAKTDPIEALRKWFTVEALVKQELGKSAKAADGPPRGSDGKFQPAKPTREAPPPKTELNGNASPVADERERAAAHGDFRSFKSDGDRRDMMRWRGQS